YNQLPMNVQQIPNCIEHREDFIKFTRNFEPIRIAQNQTSIAIIERNSQRAQLFDKRTKKKIDEVENLLRSKGIFRLWNVLLVGKKEDALQDVFETPTQSIKSHMFYCASVIADTIEILCSQAYNQCHEHNHRV
ncbi:unnamed protein product, partial [Rotaria magnacalcarata]